MLFMEVWGSYCQTLLGIFYKVNEAPGYSTVDAVGYVGILGNIK